MGASNVVKTLVEVGAIVGTTTGETDVETPAQKSRVMPPTTPVAAQSLPPVVVVPLIVTVKEHVALLFLASAAV